MARGAQFANSIARLIVSIYVAGLLAGPSPWGWAILGLHGHSQAAVWTALAAVLTVPWIIAGFISGPRLAIQTVLVGFIFWQFHFLRNGMAIIVMMMIVVPVAFVWLGARLSRRWGTDGALGSWPHWRTAGCVALVLAVYTIAIGPSVALRTMDAKFNPAASEKIEAYPAGAYIGVDGITRCICGFPDTYYTDPSGLLFLYKTNLD